MKSPSSGSTSCGSAVIWNASQPHGWSRWLGPRVGDRAGRASRVQGVDDARVEREVGVVNKRSRRGRSRSSPRPRTRVPRKRRPPARTRCCPRGGRPRGSRRGRPLTSTPYWWPVTRCGSGRRWWWPDAGPPCRAGDAGALDGFPRTITVPVAAPSTRIPEAEPGAVRAGDLVWAPSSAPDMALRRSRCLEESSLPVTSTSAGKTAIRSGPASPTGSGRSTKSAVVDRAPVRTGLGVEPARERRIGAVCDHRVDLGRTVQDIAGGLPRTSIPPTCPARGAHRDAVPAPPSTMAGPVPSPATKF